tara:strand:- start:274 stop:870 length:597 start_codon:yes stop_codon:yes gene_type:complete
MNLFIKSILLLIFIFLSGCENKEYVKDFKIEEIAVGDSLLDYFSKEDILSLQRTEDVMGNPIDLKDYVYIDAQFDNFQFETYDSLQVYYKLDDEKFIIHGIGGIIWFDTNLKKCNEKYYEVKSILNEQFKSPVKEEFLDYKDTREGMGTTKKNIMYFDFGDGSSIDIKCQDYDNELLNLSDYFQTFIFSNEFNEFRNS